MKRVLVTGSSGFLGRHLTDALVRRGDFVVGLVRDIGESYELSCSVDVYGSFDQVERTIAEYEIDTVVHLAAQTQVSTAAADPIGTFEANIRGTWQVLEACRRQKVSQVVVASSDKAYGTSYVGYHEELPLRPHGIYATSKACADMLADAYCQEFKMPVAITRCGNLYGPGHTNWSTLIPGTIRSYLRGDRPVLRSSGREKRDFLFVEDAVDGYLRVIDHATRCTFNFGTGVGTSVWDVVQTIKKITQSSLEPILSGHHAPGMGGIEIKDQIVDASKAERELHWKPKHTLEQGLTKTVEWYRKYLEVS